MLCSLPCRAVLSAVPCCVCAWNHRTKFGGDQARQEDGLEEGGEDDWGVHDEEAEEADPDFHKMHK